MEGFMENHVRRDFSAGSLDAMAEKLSGTSETSQAENQNTIKQEEASAPIVITEAPFLSCSIEDLGKTFANAWSPQMPTPDYVGDTLMILRYLHRLERFHRITMPIKACGVDPIVFKNVEVLQAETNGHDLFQIPVNESEEAEVSQPTYELIKIDDELYMSCVTDCLNDNYLGRIIEEATTSVKATGSYVFEMVGFRHLTVEPENGSSAPESSHGGLLKTLRLNTYEMSVLTAYMSQFPGMSTTYEVRGGQQCICFNTSGNIQ